MKLLAFPRDANPYQELLYAPMREQGVIVSYLDGPTRSQTLNVLCLPLQLTRYRLRGYRVLHVHWTFLFRLPFGGALSRACMELWAAGLWLLARAYGMRIVWTAHNAQPHEALFLNDHRAHRFLGRQAYRVIAHTTAAAAQVRALGVPEDRLRTIPHGSYIGIYPDTVQPAEARKRLQVPEAATVFLCFGIMRPSKGIEQLLTAFEGLPADIPAILVVAGSVIDGTLRNLLEQAAVRDDRIRLQLRYIPDDEMQLFFRAADFAVLPYERSTTSGVSLLACSFGCPLITPRQAAFADLPDEAGVQYAAGDLAGALSRALKVSPKQHAAQQSAARRYAETLSWEHIAAQTIAVIKGAS